MLIERAAKLRLRSKQPESLRQSQVLRVREGAPGLGRRCSFSLCCWMAANTDSMLGFPRDLYGGRYSVSLSQARASAFELKNLVGHGGEPVLSW